MPNRNKKLKESSPVFIGGAGRSGTTLLRVMLNSHPQLSSGPEFKLLPSITSLYNQFIKMENIMESYCINRNDIQKSFKEFINSFFCKYIQESSSNRVIEKTPHNILCMKELGEIFPNSKFIHVIRDGRDVVCSLLSMNWVDLNGNKVSYVKNIENAINYWMTIVTKAIISSASDQLKDRVITVKYESLVKNTKKTLMEILKFIGEPWSEDILNYHNIERGNEPIESSSLQVSKEIYTSSIGRWKKAFSEKDKSLFKNIAGNQLVQLGYEKNLEW